MTAWSAKVRTSSICRSVNGSTRWRRERDHPDRLALAQQRHAKCRCALLLRRDCVGQRVFRVGRHIVDMDDPPLEHDAPDDAAASHWPARRSRINARISGVKPKTAARR